MIDRREFLKLTLLSVGIPFVPNVRIADKQAGMTFPFSFEKDKNLFLPVVKNAA